MDAPCTFCLGDLELASGEALPNAELRYRTYGTLSLKGDNGVLIFSYYTGTDQSYAPWIGAGRPLDPAHHFIIVVNHFGGGVSSSPSTVHLPFPRVAVRDNVNAARRLLDELGVRRLRLTAGWSFGGMHALELAVQDPSRSDAVLAVCSAARCGPMNSVFLGSVASTLRDGDVGLDTFGRVYAGWAYSEEYFVDEVFREFGAVSADEVLEAWGRDHQTFDARDLLASLWTWQAADVGVGRGGMAAALGRVRSRTVLMPCSSDRYFTLAENQLEAAMLPGAELSVIDSPLGHIAGRPGARTTEQSAVDAILDKLLHT